MLNIDIENIKTTIGWLEYAKLEVNDLYKGMSKAEKIREMSLRELDVLITWLNSLERGFILSERMV